jgi:hypothetical protein
VTGVQRDGQLIVQEHSSAAVAAEETGSLEPYVDSANVATQEARDSGSHANGILRPKPKQAVLIAALTLAVVVIAFWYFFFSKKHEQPAGQAIKSIAVLSFKSFGADNADEYLGVGIAETLTTRLASLKSLAVRPSSAVLKYATSEKETPEAGKELNVDSVLEGAYRDSVNALELRFDW